LTYIYKHTPQNKDTHTHTHTNTSTHTSTHPQRVSVQAHYIFIVCFTSPAAESRWDACTHTHTHTHTHRQICYMSGVTHANTHTHTHYVIKHTPHTLCDKTGEHPLVAVNDRRGVAGCL